MNTFYLRGLNGLRAIAALAVLASHIMKVFGSQGLDLAGFGVTIFFALSGFLISLLLFKEKEKTGAISIRKFYIRRILRIWPLYFLFIFLVLVSSASLFHAQFSMKQIMYYVLFVPNIPFVFGGAIPMLMHYWSLGVEEQFYLFWPLVAKRLFPFFVKFCGALILGILCLKVFLNRFYGGYSLPYTFAYVCRFDCMAIGGLGAYLYYYRPQYNKLFFTRLVQIICWFIIALLFINRFHIVSLIDHEIVALVTVGLIINQVANPNTMISLENRVLNYIGKISFGLYVYHPLVIVLCGYLLTRYDLTIDKTPVAVGFVIACVLLSIATAHFSYHFIEARFLNFKNRFAVVHTTPASAETPGLKAQEFVHA